MGAAELKPDHGPSRRTTPPGGLVQHGPLRVQKHTYTPLFMSFESFRKIPTYRNTPTRMAIAIKESSFYTTSKNRKTFPKKSPCSNLNFKASKKTFNFFEFRNESVLLVGRIDNVDFRQCGPGQWAKEADVSPSRLKLLSSSGLSGWRSTKSSASCGQTISIIWSL